MERDLKLRSNNFAHSAVKLAFSLSKTGLEGHIQKQLFRCSTSVAANYRAALLAQTKKGFIFKLSIVIEEADESIFWTEFIINEKIKSREECSAVLNEAKELTAIFISSRKTAEKSANRNNLN